ncbi:MAG: DUF6516 family protein [Anaerolineales bacterium]|jgi:hypothetical protein|nr:DUF6516 family protein [Anaerolineales bacterium]
MTQTEIWQLREIAEIEFADIVSDAIFTDINELRIILHDGSFVDIWFSLKLKGRYSYHWERRAIDGTIYRHDNAPHSRWESVGTFPRHFHNGNEMNVVESSLNLDPPQAIREFLIFVREKLSSQ